MKYILDVDASKVIEAVRSTGVTVTPAMMHYAHYLISNMKNIGTWSLCNAVYGIVGGTAASHAINWKSIGTYNLSYSGSFTHSSTGVLPATAYANTSILANSLNTNSLHLSYYSRTNSASGIDRREMGCEINPYVSPGSYAELAIRRQSNQSFSALGTDTGLALTTNTDSRGYYIANRNSSTSNNLFKNGIITAASTTANSVTYPAAYMTLFAVNFSSSATINPIGFTNLECTFSTIGAGLTDTQAQQQSQIVTNAQNILNRA